MDDLSKYIQSNNDSQGSIPQQQQQQSSAQSPTNVKADQSPISADNNHSKDPNFQGTDQQNNKCMIQAYKPNTIVSTDQFVSKSFEQNSIEYSNTIQTYEGAPLQLYKTSNELRSLQQEIESEVITMIDFLIENCPNPQKEKDNQGNELDSDFNKIYCKNIQLIKQHLIFFKKWPLQLNNIKNNTRKKVSDFKRIQRDIVERAKQHLQISYSISKEDFGSIYPENEQLIKKCNEFIEQLEEEKNQLSGQNVSEVSTQLKFCFNSIFRCGEDLEAIEKSKLTTLQTDLSSLQTQREKDMMDVESEFARVLKQIYDKETEVDYLNKILKDSKELVNSYINQKKEAEVKMKNYESQSEQQKQQQIDYIQQQIQQLQTKEKDVFEQETKDKDKQFQKKMAKINSLEEGSCSKGGGSSISMGSKSCMHYIYIIDESGSFEGEPHQKGIDGIIKSVESLNNTDYATVIKFHSSAKVLFQKQQKSQININSLRNQIQNCASGGTDFQSAFQVLDAHIRNQVKPDEFVVVLFITDGQDSCNLTSIMKSIVSKCGELIFFSVGYGEINENQLRTITDVMNNTSGCTKNVGGKQLKLFFQNSNPQQLYNDLCTITVNNKVTVEDISKLVEAVEKNAKITDDTITEYYQKTAQNIQNRIQNLIKQKQALECSDNSAGKAKFQNAIDNLDQNINNLYKEIADKEKIEKQACVEIQEQKNKFSAKYPDIQQTSDLESVRCQQQSNITKQFEDKRRNLQIQIDQLEKECLLNLQLQLESVQKHGFQTVEKFNKFNKEFIKFQVGQLSFINLTDRIQDMISNLTNISGLLERNLDFAKKNQLALIQNNYTERVIQHYKNYDNSITDTDQSDAKTKILYIADNSVFQYAKNQNETKFLEQAILQLNIQELIQFHDKPKDLEKFIKNDLQKRIIGQPKNLAARNKKKSIIEKKIEDIQEKIAKLEKEMLEVNNEDKEVQIQKKIDDAEQQKLSCEDNLEKVEQEINQETSDFENDNYEKIQILRQVTQSFVTAIKNSITRYLYKASILPFMSYAAIQDSSQRALKDC